VRRIQMTPEGEVQRRYWAPGSTRAHAIPHRDQGSGDDRGYRGDTSALTGGPPGPGRERPPRQGAPAARGPRLTAREAAAVLGVSQQELTDLAARGILQPTGPDGPDARKFPAAQVEAVLNSPDVTQVLNGAAGPATVVPIGGRTAAPGSRAAHTTAVGLLPPGRRRGGRLSDGRSPLLLPAQRPASPRSGRRVPGAGRGSAESDMSTESQARYLHALSKAITDAAGAKAGCELRWRQKYPFLPYLRAGDASIWAISTSTGWRFLWNQYRSHPAADLAGAAEAIMGDLGLAESGRPGGTDQPLA
jgi:hypothetical protein